MVQTLVWNVYEEERYIPESYREGVKCMLEKPGKADYSVREAWRDITLLREVRKWWMKVKTSRYQEWKAEGGAMGCRILDVILARVTVKFPGSKGGEQRKVDISCRLAQSSCTFRTASPTTHRARAPCYSNAIFRPVFWI